MQTKFCSVQILIKYQNFKANRSERVGNEPARFTAKQLNIEKVMPTIEIIESQMKNLNREQFDEITEILEALRTDKLEYGDVDSYVIDAEFTIRDFLGNINDFARDIYQTKKKFMTGYRNNQVALIQKKAKAIEENKKEKDDAVEQNRKEIEE